MCAIEVKIISFTGNQILGAHISPSRSCLTRTSSLDYSLSCFSSPTQNLQPTCNLHRQKSPSSSPLPLPFHFNLFSFPCCSPDYRVFLFLLCSLKTLLRPVLLIFQKVQKNFGNLQFLFGFSSTF